MAYNMIVMKALQTIFFSQNCTAVHMPRLCRWGGVGGGGCFRSQCQRIHSSMEGGKETLYTVVKSTAEGRKAEG